MAKEQKVVRPGSSSEVTPAEMANLLGPTLKQIGPIIAIVIGLYFVIRYWNLVIINPLVNLMIWLYGFLGNNTFLTVVVLTVLINLITLPLTIRQQKSMQKTQALQPRIDELKKKYKDDPQRQQEEQQKLFQSEGVSMTGGCLPTLIQFPILIGLYQAITQSLASSPIQLLALSQHIYNPVPSWLPNASALIPLNSRFYWLDLAQPDPYFILPVLVVATTFLSNKMLTPPASGDSQQAQMSKSMQLTMPLMIGYISLSFPAGLAIYWVTGNIFRFIQAIATGRSSLKNLFGTEDGSFSLTGLFGISTPTREEKTKAQLAEQRAEERATRRAEKERAERELQGPPTPSNGLGDEKPKKKKQKRS
jgi:YidC/Oxa1 family membrane protein insertase